MKRIPWKIAFVLACLTLTLSACGGESPDTAAPDASDEQAATEAPAGTTDADGAAPVASGETQGVDEDSIKIGFFSVMSGPVSLSGTSAWDGLRLYIEEVNAAGGVHGRTIELVGPYDEACEPSQAVSAVKRLVSEDKVFAIFGGGCSGASLAALPTIKQSGIPTMISVSTSPKFFEEPIPNLFRAGTVSDAIQAEAITDAAIATFEPDRPAELAVANEYGQGAAERIANRLEDVHGVDPVASETYEIGATDFSSQLLKLRQANPDLVFLYAYHQEAGRIVRQAKNLGVDVPMIGGSATATPLFADAAGDTATGFVALQPVPVLTESDESQKMAEYRQKLQELYSGDLPAGRPSDYDLYAWGAAQALVKGLENAGPDLTWESFIQGLEQIDHLETGLTFPIEFSPDQHDGSRDAMLVTWNENGDRELLDYRWSEASDEQP